RARHRGGKLALEKVASYEGEHHCQRVRRAADRARAGTDCEGRAVETGVGTFYTMRAATTNAEGQWRIGAPGAGPGVGDHAANRAEPARWMESGLIKPRINTNKHE